MHLCSTVSKNRQGEDHHKDLQLKKEKRKLKVLQTAYKKNPEEFNDEPTALLSDIDQDEENMVSVMSCTSRHITHNNMVVLGSPCAY